MNWQQTNNKRIKHIRYGEKLFYRMYGEFRKELAGQLSHVQTPEEIGGVLERFGPQVDVEKFYTTFYTRVAMTFAKDTFKQMQKTVKKDLNSDINESVWLDHVLKFVDKKKFILSELTWKHIEEIVTISRNAIITGVNEGWGTERIVREMLNSIDTRDKWKAMRIARTEVVGASNLGAYEGAVSTGLDSEKIWLHPGGPGPKGFIREDHVEMGFYPPIPINEDFILPDGEPMRFPGEGPAHHVINCRCQVAFQPKDGGIVARELGEI